MYIYIYMYNIVICYIYMTYCIDLHSIAPYKHQAKGDLQKIYIDWRKKEKTVAPGPHPYWAVSSVALEASAPADEACNEQMGRCLLHQALC